MFGFLSGNNNSGPSAPKRTSSSKAPPIPSKLTPTTALSTDNTSSYPPPGGTKPTSSSSSSSSSPGRPGTLKPTPVPSKLTATTVPADYDVVGSYPRQAVPRTTSLSSHTPPERASTFKTAPLPSKLTTATSPTDYAGGNGLGREASAYPPPTGVTTQSAASSYEGQWEHVPNGPSSGSDGDSDATTFERVSFSQAEVSGDRPRGGSGLQSPPRLTTASASAKWQEEREKLRQQIDAAVAAQRQAESDRDRWERKVMEIRSSTRSDREKDKEKDKERVEALKAENQKLSAMIKQQGQQLDVAREETKHECAVRQSEVERTAQELSAAHGAHKKEVEAMKASLQEHMQRVEYLAIDRDRTRKEKESIEGSLGAEMEQLRTTHGRESEKFKAALEEVNKDRFRAHSELRKAKISFDALSLKQEECLRENDALRRELSNAKESTRTIDELKQRLDMQGKALLSAREESSALKREFRQVSTLLEDRTSELKGAQSFLTTADAFSGVEVTNTLQRLNAEVLQSTAFMAESMVELFFHERTVRVSKTDEQLAACKRASPAIGGAIVHFLGTKQHKEDPILIQIAFQAYLTYRLCWIARAWIIGGDEEHNKFIDGIYHSVQEKEAQAIAGRWRALTRAHVPSTSFDETQLAFQISTKMISGLSDILLTTGCNAPKADIAAALSSKFVEKLSFLISLAMRVNKIVGEDVTSGDFEVLAISPGTAFDGMTMEDSYDDGSVKAKGSMCRVLCATDLGLKKKTRLAMTGENQWEKKVLLKPKVALESVIDILDE